MTRAEFLTRLRRGLNGLPAETIDEIVADHEAHFVEAAAKGRADPEIAAALGNPERLAREVKAEAGLARWETEKTPSRWCADVSRSAASNARRPSRSRKCKRSPFLATRRGGTRTGALEHCQCCVSDFRPDAVTGQYQDFQFALPSRSRP